LSIKGRMTAVIAASALMVGMGSAAVNAAPVPSPTKSLTNYAPKGSPGTVQTSPKTANKGNLSSLMSGVAFRYAGANQLGITADGVYANVKVAKPYMASYDYHTLAEVAAQKDVGGVPQIVEVGWNVDRAINGDDDPHLFVYHWVNNTTSCYNGCGWVDNPAVNIDAGEDITAWIGTAKKFAIQYSGGNWWVGVDNQWIGYFPESLWTSAGVTGFNNIGYTQLFGEIALEDGLDECTDMGTGQYASAGSGSAAYFSSIGYVNGPTPNFSTLNTDANKWSAALLSGSKRSFLYGGPGETSTNTTPGNVGSC
jgi:hypothetical protein